MALKKSSTPTRGGTIKRNEITIKRKNGNLKILRHLKKEELSKTQIG